MGHRGRFSNRPTLNKQISLLLFFLQARRNTNTSFSSNSLSMITLTRSSIHTRFAFFCACKRFALFNPLWPGALRDSWRVLSGEAWSINALVQKPHFRRLSYAKGETGRAIGCNWNCLVTETVWNCENADWPEQSVWWWLNPPGGWALTYCYWKVAFGILLFHFFFFFLYKIHRRDARYEPEDGRLRDA